MKTFLTFFLTLPFFLLSLTSFSIAENDQPAEKTGLELFCSPELMDLTSNWAASYESQYPDKKVTISRMTSEMALAEGQLYLTTQAQLSSDALNWQMVIGHDVIVPITSSNNPLLQEIQQQGIQARSLALLAASELPNWEQALGGTANAPSTMYLTDNEELSAKIANYTNLDKDAILATKLSSPKELIQTVQENIYSIGFCKLVDLINTDSKTFNEQISILPIDKNRNGRLDHFEDIYQSPEALSRGVWLGKYPRELSGEVYAVASSQPSQKNALEFLNWLNGSGQELLAASGYSPLSSRAKTGNTQILTPLSEPINLSGSTSGLPLGWLLAGTFVIIILAIYRFSRSKRKKLPTIGSEDLGMTPAMNESSIESPAGLFYDKSHTWAFMERDGFVKVGIDDFLQRLTGPLTQVKLKKAGTKVHKGEKILTIIREGKQLEIHTPVSGIIKAQNQSLLDSPTQLNTSPYADGWVYQIEPLNWDREVRLLFRASTYREWLEDEFTRLKDFLAHAANANSMVFDHLILQDGGEITDQILGDLAPEIWDDFQTKFIDSAR
ncbi:hypothetical protein [Sunxiuqinia elliptica]|uniref:Glycine cleavage system H lipoate-binding protein n=1 Tax=Sunxiuqinia elliptica TaxID=655355 RepID=A0A4R6H735_9BACT|nr:hypothetical protein [Sunxiuqinia elliptica]TDO04030.1 glycine cleavage system H lipoate-binding protein [Sunxiuqinia elliptica]TDO62312.1 glycine cleavage system H lipoate-binding protein [Sunxiuqinia elliptica]